MDTDKIGRFIAARRKTCGLTQQQLAEELGITNKAISKWETGQGMPDVTTLPLLAEILGVSVDELLNAEIYGNQKEGSPESIYAVNKIIYWFRTIACLTIFFALAGNIIPYFMMRETTVTGGFLFGSYFELCSASIFFVFYFRMKNEINAYNKRSLLKLEAAKIRNQFLRFELWLWLFAPVVLLVHLGFMTFSYDNLIVQIITALVLTAIVGALVLIKYAFHKSDLVARGGRI